jgi:hypothetical protein
MQVVSKAHGLTICKEKYWKDKRSGLNNIESLLRQGFTWNDACKLNSNWTENVENIEWSYFDSLMKNTFDVMTRMKNQGHTLHLVSARNNIKNGLIQLQTLGIENFFDTTSFVTLASGLAKSDYFHKLNLDCYIGDTEVDFVESQISNISFYPVITGMRSKDFFINLGLNSLLDLTLEQFLEKKI